MKQAIHFFCVFLYILTDSFSGNSAFCDQNPDYTVLEDRAKLKILTPLFADRLTLKLRLANGLEVYLVSDPHSDKSSAALVVKSGSWEDPKEYPGTAHFLEHMLFLGTKKYPNESEFDSFVTEHNGMSNAFTSIDFTAYVFSINHAAFPEALDRFSSFFKDPLLNPSGIKRELSAIDQEYAKNIENDDMREYYVQKELSNPAHPNHAFNMGNSASLAKVSNEILRKWYQDHYSANHMRLALISNFPMEQLKQLVIENFIDIPDIHLSDFKIDVPMVPSDLKSHIVYIEPIKHIRQLSLVWELPKKFSEMRESKPEELICQVLGYGGKSSLLAELKRKKFAESLECSGAKAGPDGFEFALEISLTDLGVKNVYSVITHCFQAIQNCKKNGIPKHIFDELNKLTKLSYQYQEHEDAFEHILKLAEQLAEEDLTTFPEQTLLIQRFNPVENNDFLSYLTPENCLFYLIAPTALTKVELERTEQWLGAAYAVKTIPEDILEHWKFTEPDANITFPPSNPYIPQKLTLVPQKLTKIVHQEDGTPKTQDSQELFPHPQSLFDNPSSKVYFSLDTRYLVPKISWVFEIKTPAINQSNPESMVLADLYIKNIDDFLSDLIYPASAAGLNFSILPSANGLFMTIDGYSEKASALFFDVIKAMKEFRPRTHKFRMFKNSLQRQYQNGSLDNPLSQTYDILKSILYKDYTTDKAKVQAIKSVTFEQFEEFASSLFHKTFLEGTFYGNQTRQEVKELVQRIVSVLNSQPYSREEQLREEVIILPADKGPFLVEMKSSTQGNVAALALESIPFTFQAKAAQQVLMLAMKDPFFNELRTIQQTGYIVLSQPEEFEQHLFNIFCVQSNTHDGRDLLARFELFIERFLQEMEQQTLPPQKFENIKEALLITLKTPPKNIAEMGVLLHKFAFKYHEDFDRIKKQIEGLQNLTYDNLIKLSRESMGKLNKRRLGILLMGNIPQAQSLQYQKCTSIARLRNLSSYTSRGQVEPYTISRK